jgi:hypothetical protein
MPLFDDVMDVENDGEDYDAIQRLINAGTWSLQGSFGRTMMAAIESGNCLLGKTRARDAYGNVIPSRFDVAAGTKGSFTFVQKAIGFEAADARDKL